MTTTRIILAGVLGGIAMFIWTSIAHMALPLGHTVASRNCRKRTGSAKVKRTRFQSLQHLLSLNGLMIVVFELLTHDLDAEVQTAADHRARLRARCDRHRDDRPRALRAGQLAGTVVIWTLGEMVYAPVTGAYVTSLAPGTVSRALQWHVDAMWSLECSVPTSER